MRSKTIHIFLLGAEPNGIKIAELSVSTAKVYVIPRDKINSLNSRADLNAPTLYMLFDDERTNVYIGECENFINRIKKHVENKKNWEWAVAVVSSNGSLDKADVKFLESYAINKALEIGRFNVENKTSPNKNSLHEFKQEAILDFFDDVELLISTLGFNLFEPFKDINSPEETEKQPVNKVIREYDTIVAPCRGDGLDRAFIKKKAWWAVRINSSNIEKLKYISLYEAAPIKAIRYYARIIKIEPYEGVVGKYIIYHDGNIIKFDNEIKLGDTPQLALYGPRYYKLEDMMNSKSIAELTTKAFGVLI